MAKSPNNMPITRAPAMPPANPTVALFVSCAASTDVIAAVSIIPSIPRLMMPLRSTTSSPSTASSSGVEATIASTTASIMRRLLQPPRAEEDEGQADDGLSERGHGRGDVDGPLQLVGAGRERAEKECRGQRGQGMELGEQRHGDAGVSVPRGEALEEAMRHAEQLDAAGQPRHPAGDGH